MKPIIAIDPGKSGGIVYSDSHGRSECHKMPETEGDVLDLLQELAAREPDAVFYLERVAGMIGGKGTGPAMFNLDRKSVV